MAPRPAPSTQGLWFALVVGCILSGVVLLMLQLFFLPLILVGTSGAVIAALIAGWVIFKSQQSIIDSLTRWRPPLAIVALTGLPGLAVGFFSIRAGLGLATAAVPGCAVQGLALRVVAGAAMAGRPVPAPAAQMAEPLPGPVVPAPIPAEPFAPTADPEPPLTPDTSNPAAGRLERS